MVKLQVAFPSLLWLFATFQAKQQSCLADGESDIDGEQRNEWSRTGLIRRANRATTRTWNRPSRSSHYSELGLEVAPPQLAILNTE